MPSLSNIQRLPNWRVVLWGGAAALLSLPAVAMLFTTEVAWGPGDFMLMACLLGLCCGAIDLAVRRAPNRAYVGGVLVTVAGMFLLVWANLAVGLVGDEGNPLNLIFHAIPAIGVIGAFVSRWRATGLARTLRVMAILQLASLAVIPSGQPRLLIALGGFAIVWWAAARMFTAASRSGS